MRKKLALLMASLFLLVGAVWAQAPVATPAEAITGLLNRIGGNGAAEKFEIVIDENLAEEGKDVFVITSQNGKPCIKGNTQLSVATGINWYLNHYAHINLTWNNLTTDLSAVNLPVPAGEEKHVSSAKYRYDFNTCTFSYSMAFWTWERWQKEIDWMALHGINAPLNLVGLDVVTREFLRELKVSESDINAYIAGPGFIAWFAMNNLEGWGGTINSPSTGVDMSGNPDWWYTRQENLCRNMLRRMRELGMQPVIPGFSGQIPNSLSDYTISGFSSSDVINGGTWAGGYTRPDILHPNSSSYATLAPIYYKHLEAIMGVSELYSMDPFHEGGLPSAVTNATCYPPIMAALDTYHNAVEDAAKTSYNVGTEDNQAKWIIQYWQNIPQSGAFSSMSSYGDRFIGLDLFSDNIYAGNAAKWRDTGNNCYYKGRPYIYCMLHNFGGRSGLHGRLETTMDGYFQALANNNNCQGIGATPEGTETNPILYDMLFELPWMDSNPGADAWLEEYAYSRYGVQNEKALSALKNLKKSVWDCKVNQQGTSEAVILARPNWTVGSVSSWSTSAIYWDTQDVLQAADELSAIKDVVTANGGKDGIANYNYDFIDVVRQAMVDYAAQLLPLIKAAHDKGDNTEYTRLYQLYLQLMLDLDTMLSYDENFKLERWTSLARDIADEVNGTTENDRNWLEWNARTQVTVWSKGDTDLHDYSNRCWAGLIKDFHYKRWKHFFENNGNAPNGGWFNGFEYPWTVDFNEVYDYAGDYSQIVIPKDMTATEKAAQTFGNYFGRVKGATKNYIFPMGVATNATKSGVIPSVYRGQTVTLPLEIGKGVTISSVWVDLNNDGAKGDGETLTAANNQVAIPADAAIGKTTAQVVYSDGTDITFSLALVEDITDARTVTVVAGSANGSVAIEGTNELSITNTEAVKMTATANTGYNFKDWTDDNDNVVSNDNPFIYYGKEAATFTANFIQDKWGVVACNGTFSADIAGYSQFIHNLTLAYYNREAETIFETTTAPTEIFNTIPQIVNVPQGASFTVNYDDGNGDGLKYCYFRAFIDLNQDGDFDDEGELLKETGTNGAQNTAVCSGSVNVVLPYNMPLGITHMRLRFDGAWDNGNNPSGRGAKDASIRPVYELIINVTDKSDKAATVNVETNNADWGTVEVWTDETPDGSTGTTWSVSSNIPMYLRATKASEDVEFLGWYDHYGRLLTENLEQTMYAREDATYTAKFRKALDIDGWVFEYRTEPGDELRVKGELGSTAPVGGKMYYIYAKTNGGNYYLYNNNGTLATTTTPNGNAYIWVSSADGDYLTFENLAEKGKYIGYGNTGKGLTVNTTPVKLDISSAEAVTSGCVCIKRIGDDENGKYMVLKNDGSEFNRNSVKTNGDYCSDYVFVEITAPDVVILTSVRQSGDHDLDIPETVGIMGEQCKIVGFDNNLFKDNKDLWTISVPSTIEEMSNNKVFTGVVKGKGANQANNNANYITTDLGTTLAAGEDWSISLTIEDNGNNFNEYGSALIATGNAPMNSTYGKGFQLYLQAGGGLVVKTDVDSDANKLTNLTKGTKFRIDVVYTHANTQLVVTATPLTSVAALTAARSTRAARAAASLTITQDMSDFSVVSHAIPEGVNITELEVRQGTEPDPFEGCNNLLNVEVADGCEDYYVADGTLYRSGGIELHELADEEKEEEIRALGTLIDNTKALMDVIATSIDPVGKDTEIALSTTESVDNYIWCNAPTANEGVDKLIDNNPSTILHTAWNAGTVSAYQHYLLIELADGEDLSNFKFRYKARTGDSNTMNMGDIPSGIKVYGSKEEGGVYDELYTTSGLTQSSGYDWTSSAITGSPSYRYLRFNVTANNGYWHMAEFDLFKLTSLVEVAPVYKNLAGITNDEATNVYDNLVNALYVYNNGGTAAELQAAYDALEPLYTALNAKKGKVLNGVYHINFDGGQVFVGYTDAAVQGLSNDVAGYKLFDAIVDNSNNATTAGSTSGDTPDNLKTLHNNAIAAKVAADELFTIVPNSEGTGYTISAQGLYLHSTRNGGWAPQLLSDDANQAGVYLIEESATAGLYKMKSNRNDIQYLNDWGPVFGNDKSTKDTGHSIFSFTPVTEFTLAVPTSGVTTLCLPFNVVLPEGVTAYEVNLDKKKNYTGYALEAVASAGETLAKNTPVIIKATANDYTLTITMDEEGAKHATANNVLSSGLIKTTVAPATTKYAFDGENFNVITANTEVAANQCWMELSENCGSVIYGGTPAYLLTTDEANPILYKIIIKRAEDGSKVLQYDEPTSEKIKIVNVAENKSYQAWYFMQGENGLLIKPYNAEGKVLTVESTDNGVGKAMISPITTGTYQEWDITKSSVSNCTDYFYIRINGTANAVFSHNGGFAKGDYMGIWSGGWNSVDGGSLFKFEEVEFPNDNPRFYQLSDVKAILTDGEDIPVGTTVGLYSNVEPYRDACETASDLIGAGNTSASADCYAAYKALRNTKAAITYNEPDESKFYTIKSVSNAAYCKDKLVRTSYEPAEHDNSGSTKYDHRHLVFDAANAIPQQSLAIFQFVKTGTTGEYLMKNLHTGLYVKNFAQDAEHMGTEADAQRVVISGYTDGAVTLKKRGDSNPMHAQDTHDVIVTYGAQPGNASTWVIEEANKEDVAYSTTISSYGLSGLYLNYPVSVPDGVTAYYVSMAEAAGGIAKLTKIEDGIIPANEGVILEGEPNADISLPYVSDNVDPISENLLEGANYTSYIQGESETRYYLFGAKSGKVGLYWTYKQYNSDGSINEANTDKGGYFKCSANKVYLPYNASSGVAKFSFRFDDTTGIDDLLNGLNGEELIYDLQGRRIMKVTESGIYIVNGQKRYIHAK